jgi:hypothetical protein
MVFSLYRDAALVIKNESKKKKQGKKNNEKNKINKLSYTSLKLKIRRRSREHESCY